AHDGAQSPRGKTRPAVASGYLQCVPTPALLQCFTQRESTTQIAGVKATGLILRVQLGQARLHRRTQFGAMTGNTGGTGGNGFHKAEFAILSRTEIGRASCRERAACMDVAM